MTPDEKDIRAKGPADPAREDSVAEAPVAAAAATPETCGLHLECPVCGWKAEGIRCVRCGALKITSCGGSCGGCGGCAEPV